MAKVILISTIVREEPTEAPFFVSEEVPQLSGYSSRFTLRERTANGDRIVGDFMFYPSLQAAEMAVRKALVARTGA